MIDDFEDDTVDYSYYANKHRLITKPYVALIGQTTFNLDAMDDWVAHNDLEDLAGYEHTPIGNLINNISKYPDDSQLMAEFGGRFCYRSWAKGRSSQEYITNIIESKHNSVLRHLSFNFVIEGVSRALSHELVRHAAGCAPSQESQRYVDANEMNFILPPLMLNETNYSILEMRKEYFWNDVCVPALKAYKQLQHDFSLAITEEVMNDPTIEKGFKKSTIKKRVNEASRSALPNAAETRLLFTMNGDALRHVLAMRGDAHADLEIRRLAVALYDGFDKNGWNGADYLLYDFQESKDIFGKTLERKG